MFSLGTVARPGLMTLLLAGVYFPFLMEMEQDYYINKYLSLTSKHSSHLRGFPIRRGFSGEKSDKYILTTPCCFCQYPTQGRRLEAFFMLIG